MRVTRREPTGLGMGGRTVFITGAARGIGAATAERLHARGANVALVGLEPERLEAASARLGEGRAAWFEADVTDFAALERAVASTVERFGGIDVAIANAGLAFTGGLATAPMEQVERTLAVNLLGVWRTDRAVIGQIVERRGYLLNVASLAAAVHAPLMGPYAASKAGVEALTDVLRVECAPSGARVGCAYFGFMDTDLVRGAYASAATQALRKGTPAFLMRPAPMTQAVDVIERAVGRRASRIWAPRWVGLAIALRGMLQPLTEWGTLRDPASLGAALRLADPALSDGEEDLELGVAARALPRVSAQGGSPGGR